MFKKNKDVVELVSLGKRVLGIVYFLLVVLSVYLVLIISKELLIGKFIITLLKILSPLFIGIFIAWLFDPFVKYLSTKGLRRVLGALISYLLTFLFLFILFSSIIPIFIEQTNELVNNIPLILDKLQFWINSLFDKLSVSNGLDIAELKAGILASLETFSIKLTSLLPALIINFLAALISGFGIFLIGLIIGFYLLISFDSFNDSFITYFPKKIRNNARELLNEVSTTFRSFVKGIMISTTIVFIISTIGFYFIGLKGALLFGFFCGVTNIIPFIGPYLGGIPAVIAGLSQSLHIGILVLIIIIVVQLIEGNLIHPFLMSKVMKLHPVTIMVGLLFFGYHFKIIGLIIATPLIASVKTIVNYFIEKRREAV